MSAYRAVRAAFEAAGVILINENGAGLAGGCGRVKGRYEASLDFTAATYSIPICA